MRILWAVLLTFGLNNSVFCQQKDTVDLNGTIIVSKTVEKNVDSPKLFTKPGSGIYGTGVWSGSSIGSNSTSSKTGNQVSLPKSFTSNSDLYQSIVTVCLFDDNTFRYIDRTFQNRPKDLQGRWSIYENSIRLYNYTSDWPIFDKWKLDEKGICPCIRSRKNLEWRRLCKMN